MMMVQHIYILVEFGADNSKIDGSYDKNGSLKDLGVPDAPSIMPRMAKLTDDILEFSEEVQTIDIIDKDGNPILTKDLERRFFEAPWIHKYEGVYYMSYSTGDTHLIAYATSDNPGPFVIRDNAQLYRWTNHHSTLKVASMVFFLSTQNIRNTLRNVKLTLITIVTEVLTHKNIFWF